MAVVDRAVARGAIPAGAGSSWPSWSSSARAGGHPRGRGKPDPSFWSARALWGPSPRVRGAVRAVRRQRPPAGTTPAGAGSSRGPAGSGARPRDHPRGCGEQSSTQRRERCIRGPSPRVRGAVIRRLSVSASRGTIPAGAGSSTGVRRSAPGHRDHPRGCGEQFRDQMDRVAGLGPSPRVRGAGRAGSSSTGPGRTIPAGAGSSFLTWGFIAPQTLFRGLLQFPTKAAYRLPLHVVAASKHRNSKA